MPTPLERLLEQQRSRSGEAPSREGQGAVARIGGRITPEPSVFAGAQDALTSRPVKIAVAWGLILLVGVVALVSLKTVVDGLSAVRGEATRVRANVLVDEGNFAGAVPVYDQALRENLSRPSRARALGGRGWAKTKLDRDPEAIRDFDAALQLNPDLVFALLDRGLAFHRLGNFQRAMTDYDRTILLDRNSVDAYRNRALIFAQRGQFAEAIADIDEAIRCAPSDPRWFSRRGRIYATAGQLDAALASFESAIRLAPDFVEALYGRARLRIEQGEPARALSEISAAVQKQPNSPQIYFARALIRADLDELEDAVEDCAAAIELRKDFAAPYAVRSMLEFRLGSAEAALAFAAMALQLDSKLPLPYQVRGRVYDLRHKNAAAIAEFDQAIANDCAYVDAVVWRALAEAHGGHYEIAARDLENAVRTFPGVSSAHLMQAWFLSTCPDGRLRDGVRAVTEARRGATLAREDAYALDILATAFAEAGDFASAIEFELQSLNKTASRSGDCLRKEARLQEFRHGIPFRDSPELN
ncbi:MAG: tetratricopeptide repeat protein [Verrucomicrobiota bacterium]|nr:tetratricopeptide repeat protein [Verrucomicrobiota bacterium]